MQACVWERASVCVRESEHVCCVDCPRLTGYTDSPSCLYIERKRGHWALPASLIFTLSHTYTHACMHCIRLSPFFFPLSPSVLYLSPSTDLHSAVWGLNVDASAGKVPLPVSLSEECVCNIYFIGISPYCTLALSSCSELPMAITVTCGT